MSGRAFIGTSGWDYPDWLDEAAIAEKYFPPI